MISIIFIAVLIFIVFAPQLWVKWVMNKHSKELDCMPGNGGQFADYLRQQFELPIQVESTTQGDHYDPVEKKVRLNNKNYQGKSITAIAIAAHEIGHAIQDMRQDKRLKLRTKMVKMTRVIERVAVGVMMISPLVGLLTQSHKVTLIILVISYLGFINSLIIQLITLPIEWDASFGKALPVLEHSGKFPRQDLLAMKSVLTAAAFTYVAASLMSLINILRWFRR